ncbi:uncharacterized protein LOC132706933 [Cylas formicarius]|uniref:uncharacterized protein LOC132706933 n=1 Tax=Cylas formicarius TaxID=197179 RepID=UPI002958631D|nr:uncharacterized protein LOC132706933 [Cylas formicarius]
MTDGDQRRGQVSRCLPGYEADVLVAHQARRRQGSFMANTRGPKQKTRQLLMTVTHSILLYGAEIWGGAMEVKKYRQAMLSVQRRGALRIACAYRTVPESAVLVIAGVIPIDLLALERKSVYERIMELGRARASKEPRNVTMDDWQT